MKKIIYSMLLIVITGLSAFAAVTNWQVKEPYEVKFSGGKIHGEFRGLKAHIVFDKSHPETSKISASIEVATVATGFFLKNGHVQDALDADKYPVIHFASTSVTKSGDGYNAEGKLTMKGVTKSVTIHFTFEDKGGSGVFNGNLKIIPKEFNVTHSGTPAELAITLKVPVAG